VCASRSDVYSQEVKLLIQRSRDKGVGNLQAVAKQTALTTSISNSELTEYFSRFTYTFNDELRQSLEEFFRMAYYYSMLQDVPEIILGN